jgi:hypothetical protein
VAEEMGNSPAMVKKQYFQVVTKTEAVKFWSLHQTKTVATAVFLKTDLG